MTDQYTDEQLLAMPIVNVALLDETLDYIETHQDEWDQGVWAEQKDCGTTCCFAGTVVVQSGHELIWDDYVGFSGTYASRVSTGESISKVAADELGLTTAEANRLFLGTLYPADYEDMWSAEQLKAGRLKAVKVEVERIRYRARKQEEAFERAARQIGEANSKRDVVRLPERAKAS